MYPRRPVWITAKQLPDFISEKTEALIEYMKIIHGEDYPTDKRVYSKNFRTVVATLQVDNLITNSTLSDMQNNLHGDR
jgi:hypothetical protein